jgi:hypothetical protein
MNGMKVFSIAIVAGARPNFMKIAPIVRALRERAGAAREAGVDMRVSIVHTGQHYDENMSEVFFRELEISEPGTDPAAILAASEAILSGRGKKGTVPPLRDGYAAERIADILLLQENPEPGRSWNSHRTGTDLIR